MKQITFESSELHTPARAIITKASTIFEEIGNGYTALQKAQEALIQFKCDNIRASESLLPYRVFRTPMEHPSQTDYEHTQTLIEMCNRHPIGLETLKRTLDVTIAQREQQLSNSQDSG